MYNTNKKMQKYILKITMTSYNTFTVFGRKSDKKL